MTVAAFLRALRSRDIRISLNGDRLSVDAPQELITEGLRADLAARKEELLAFLRAGNQVDDQGITPRSSEVKRPPLSFAQRRLWLLDALDPGSSAYNIATAIRLRGQLDRDAVGSALREIATRHEVLRTSLPADGSDEPWQRIAETPEVPLAIIDLSSSPAAEREAEGLRLAAAEAQRPFDLRNGPLIRGTLLLLDADDHVLLVTIHHVAADGWSMQVLGAEFAALYHACRNGEPANLPPLPVQYADFAIWQRNRLDHDGLATHLEYWKEKLSGTLPVLDLPTDHPRPPIRSSRGGLRTITIEPEGYEAIARFCRDEQATPFMTLLAAFAVLLRRLSGQDDILIGSPFAGRSELETEALIGFFVNTVVLRAELSGNPTFREVVRRVKQTALEAHAHQDLPFEMLLEELKPPTDLSRSPLFQVFFNLLDTPPTAVRIPGLEATPFGQIQPDSKFDLTLYVEDRKTDFRITAVHSLDLFAPERIDELLAQLRQILFEALADPDREVTRYSLSTGAARAVLPDPAAPLRSSWDGTVGSRFAVHAARRPDHPAAEGLGYRWSYAELDRAANRLARELRASGVDRQDIVAVVGARDPSLLLSLLGILKAGAAFVVLDPSYPAPRLLDTLTVAAPRAVIRLAAAGPLPRELDGPLEAVPVIPIGSGPDVPAGLFPEHSPAPLDVEIGPDDLAYLAFTSGTTGAPKGIRGTHRPLGHFFEWYRTAFELTAADRISVLSGLAHDPLLRDLFAALWVGGTVCFPPEAPLAAPHRIAGWLRESGVTVVHLTPPMADLITASAPTGSPLPASAIRLVCFGGDRLTRSQAARFQAIASAARITSFYGATETPQAMAVMDLERSQRELVPIGTGIADVQLLILNPAGQLAGFGELGEIHVRTPYLTQGYLGDSGLTGERYRPNPFSRSSADRLYRTGDLGRYLLDGTVELLGRADRQVKLRGFRIELGEIEAALGTVPGVAESAVVLRDDLPGESRLVGYVVPVAPDLIPAPAALRVLLSERLPDYMIPATVVPVERLPRTPNGKLDLRALPRPAPAGPAETLVAARDELETALVEIWEQVLGRSPIGIRTSFFDLGGHSLLAVRLFHRIEVRFGVRLSLAELFKAPTIERLAGRLRDRDTGPAAAPAQGPIEPASDPALPAPLSFAQRQLWLLDRLSPGGSAYNIPLSVRIHQRLDEEALRRALDEVVRRHAVLRVRVRIQNDEPVQVAAPEEPTTLAVTDLSELSAADREAEARRLATLEAREPFQLNTGPLFRARLVKLADDDNVFLLTVHHIVADGWSIQILSREVTALYEAFRAGRPSPLPALPIQYLDFARWQKRFIQGQALDAHLDYWRERLAAPLPVLDLPMDRPRPPIRTSRGGQVVTDIEAGLHDAVHRFSRDEGLTIFMTLFAAYTVLLRRVSGQDDIVVGSPFAGRGRPETEPLIGFFVNTVVLRTSLAGNPTFREVARRVRQVALEAHAHQDVPFERLLEELKPDPDLSRTPLFQAFFNLLDFSKQLFDLPDVALDQGEAFDRSAREAKFDLTMYVSETRRGFKIALVYNADLFDEERAREMLAQFRQLLAEMITDPDRDVCRYSLVTPGGRAVVPDPTRPLRSTWSGAIVQHLAANAARQPGQIAVDAPGCQWTYRQLDSAANRLAHELRARGIGPRDVVAVVAARDPSLLLSLLGILKAGGAFMLLDPAYPPARLAECIRLGAPKVALRLAAAGPLAEPLEAALSTATSITIPTGPDLVETLLPSRSAAEPDGVSEPDDLAYIAFTSGTTGAPKAIRGTHRPLAHFFEWYRSTFDLKPADRISVLSGLAHDPLLRDLFAALWVGGTVCFPEPAALAEPGALAPWLRDRRITVTHLTPALSDLIAGSEEQENPEDHPEPTEIRLACFGGDRLTRAHIRRFRRIAPTARCVNFYGATETPQVMAMATIPTESPGDADASEVIPLGHGIANVQLLVVTPAGQLAGIGELGEVLIRTPYLSGGYLDDPELTRARFGPNPFSGVATDLAYRTGDLGRYRPNGEVEFVGRADRQVKLRGFRIELGEIEAALASFPGARESIASLREDTPGEPRLVGYLVGSWPSPPGYEMIRAHLAGRLAAPLIPSAVVTLAALPRTPNGKIDHAALPAPDGAIRQDGATGGAPADGIELRLCRIWEEALGLPVVRVHDDFFELGGHSLTAVRVFGQVEVHFGKRLSLATLIHAPTVSKLAAILRGEGCLGSDSSLVPIETRGTRAPFFCVHGIGGNVLNYFELARELGADQPFYGLQAVGLDGKAVPLLRIEDMARHYLSEIRKVQPHGPYRIGGGCMGGVVAYAMANQLHEEGEPVALLAFLDVPAPIFLSARDRLTRRLYQSRVFGLPLRILARAVTWWRLPPAERVETLRRMIRRRIGGEQQRTERMVERNREVTQVSVHAANYWAMRSYRPTPFRGRIAHFFSDRRRNRSKHDRRLHWQDRATEGQEIFQISGDDSGLMLTRPHVELLARRLREVLDRVADPGEP